VANVPWAANEHAAAPGVVVFSSTETVFEPALPTARSGRPSPLKSPTATYQDSVPVAKLCGAAKVGVAAPGAVVFSITETVPGKRLGTARSSRPSALKSPEAAEKGESPATIVVGPKNEALSSGL